MDSELLGKVVRGVKTVTCVETFLVLFDSGGFKESGRFSLAVGKTIGKLKAVIRLDAHSTSPTGIGPDMKPTPRSSPGKVRPSVSESCF